MTVLWAASNDGAEDTINAYAQAPFVITVAAGSKEGVLADFLHVEFRGAAIKR